MLGSLSCFPVMDGGVFFPLRKGILCGQRMGRNDRSRSNRGTALRNTNDCRLRNKGGLRLGAYTSLGRTRMGCVCLLADIVVIGRKGVFVVTRGVL